MSVTSAYSELGFEIIGQLPLTADTDVDGSELNLQKVLRYFGKPRELESRLPVMGRFHTLRRLGAGSTRNAHGQHCRVVLDTGAEAAE